MEAVWWGIVGILTGLFSRLILPREDTDSLLLDVWAGAAGGVLGGYMVRTFGLAHSLSGYAGWSALMAFAGAAATLLFVGGLTTREEGAWGDDMTDEGEAAL